MKIAYFDCFAGAAGDMIAAAMLDAGLDEGLLRAELATLGIAGLKIEAAETMRCGIRARSFRPSAPGEQHARGLSDIVDMITESKISGRAKKLSVEIFERLGRVEAGIHGKSCEEIHFHEIGAVDSIVDVVSACVGLEALGVEKVYCSALAVGSGVIKCDHGILPVPSPATVALLKEAGCPTAAGFADSEMLTPTATAILTSVVSEFGTMPGMRIDSVGYGAGTREFEGFPNVLRLVIGESADEGATTDCVCLLECNVDDATGEAVGFVMEKLFDQGALDVFTTPIQMKHNRCGVKVSVICGAGKSDVMEKILFAEGVTFGVRKQLLQRSKLAREFVTVETEFGKIKIKVGSIDGGEVAAKPEYSDCKEAAKRYNAALKTVQQAAMDAFRGKKMATEATEKI